MIYTLPRFPPQRTIGWGALQGEQVPWVRGIAISFGFLRGSTPNRTENVRAILTLESNTALLLNF